MILSKEWSPSQRSSDSPSLVASRVVRAFESENCEVERSAQGVYEVVVPGLDAGVEQWLPLSMMRPLCRPFWDRMEVRVSPEGAVSCRARYGSVVQLATHGALVVAGAWELSGGEIDPARAAMWLLINAIPAVLTFATLSRCRSRVFQRLSDAKLS
jgi:hypothetical protein